MGLNCPAPVFMLGNPLIILEIKTGCKFIFNTPWLLGKKINKS